MGVGAEKPRKFGPEFREGAARIVAEITSASCASRARRDWTTSDGEGAEVERLRRENVQLGWDTTELLMERDALKRRMVVWVKYLWWIRHKSHG